MFSEIAAVLAPLFLCAGIGFAWGRLDRPFDEKMITGLSINFGVPCLIFSSLTKLRVSSEAFAEMAGAFGFALICMMAVGAAVIRVARLEIRTFLPAMTFANTGNMGLPVCMFAYGGEGLVFTISIFVMATICGVTVGPGIYSGRTSFDVVTRNPLVYVVAVTLVFMIAEWAPPPWLANTVELIGGMGIPLMILSPGVAIAKLRVTAVGRCLSLAAVKLAVGFAVGYSVAETFEFSGVARGVLIVMCSMPTAVHNYVFAQHYGRDPSEVAGMVLISTALSFATLPFLLLLVL